MPLSSRGALESEIRLRLRRGKAGSRVLLVAAAAFVRRDDDEGAVALVIDAQ